MSLLLLQRIFVPCLLVITASYAWCANASSTSTLAPTKSGNETPLVKARRTQIAAALKLADPLIPLSAGSAKLDKNQTIAQTVAITEPRVKSLTIGQPGNRPLLVEVFGVYPLRPSDITEPIAACRPAKSGPSTCYRVEIYAYAANATFMVFVDTATKKVVNMATVPRTQPDIPDHLTKLALEIATQSPEVAAALGGKPGTDKALMASTKTSLSRTRCERSRHLCVAPTFVQGERALWAIVDLTDLRLVGTRWTEVGKTAGATPPVRAVTEARLQNEVITETFCEKETSLTRNGWSFDYMLTSSDGLRVANAKFNGAAVFDSVKLVDWHVSYSRTDAFGYSDAVGCPYFSQSAVIAAEPPRVEEIAKDGKAIGFALVQHYWSEGWPTPCNYHYIQRNEFYNDGRFRPMAASVGRGCGNDGTYRPVTRIAFSEAGNFGEWDGKSWSVWAKERWQLADEKSATTSDGYRYRFSATTDRGMYITPSKGQFGDGGRGDSPYVYVTRHAADRDEGASDLPTLGPCCNVNHEQGPEKFINNPPEAITNNKLVLWYVPVLKNDSREGKEYCWANSVIENGLVEPKMFPCFSGPMITPFGLNKQAAAK
jgi:hypothetical protein